MPFDLKQWLGEVAADGSLSAQDIQAAEALLSKGGIARKIEEGYLRQSDYDRNLNRLKADYAQKESVLNTTAQELNKWKSQAEQKIADAVSRYQATQSTLAQTQAKIKEIAATYGIDDAEVQVIVNAAAAQPQPQPPATPAPAAGGPDPSQYVPRTDFENFSKTAAQTYPLLVATMQDLAVEHQALFGKPLTNSTDLVRKAMEQQRDIRAVWEEEHQVVDRRAQVERDRLAAWEQQIRAEERTKLATEQSIPSLRPDAARSPIFASNLPRQAQPPAAAPQVPGVTPPAQPAPQPPAPKQDRVQAAVAAFNAGTYRQTA